MCIRDSYMRIHRPVAHHRALAPSTTKLSTLTEPSCSRSTGHFNSILTIPSCPFLAAMMNAEHFCPFSSATSWERNQGLMSFERDYEDEKKKTKKTLVQRKSLPFSTLSPILRYPNFWAIRLTLASYRLGQRNIPDREDIRSSVEQLPSYSETQKNENEIFRRSKQLRFLYSIEQTNS